MFKFSAGQRSRNGFFLGFLFIPVLGMVGCAVGPDYHLPATSSPLPSDWRWQVAQPRDAAPKGPWWRVFQDGTLDRLEDQALSQNLDLQAAVARVDQSRAQARLEGSSFFPSLTLDPAYQRQENPADYPFYAKAPVPILRQRFEPYNSFSIPVDLGYEVDLWGRVRRSFESARALAEARVADFETVRLTLAGDVAIDYFTLRELDREIVVLQQTIANRQEALRANRIRCDAGRATSETVLQAATELTNAQADLAESQRSRSETQDALAVLQGDMASTFTLSPSPLSNNVLPPLIPVDVPASLLERRPDVASAERTVASASADIGVAYAAFFPRLSLTGQFGYLSAKASDLFAWSNTVWSYGPSLSLPLFNGGQNTANLHSARGRYEETVAQYRGVVLSAVRDVEDALGDLHFLRVQHDALLQSVQTSQQAKDLAEKRFQVGQANYTEVTVAEEAELTAQRAEVEAAGQIYYATVRLIKALGGSWQTPASTP